MQAMVPDTWLAQRRLLAGLSVAVVTVPGILRGY